MAGYSLDIELKNFDRFKQKLQSTPQVIGEIKGRILRTATLVAEGTAKKEAPIDRGILKGSITSRLEGDIGRVGTNLKYAPYQEFGTGIYGPRKTPITPKRGRFLVFKKGGKTIFAKSVKGVRPRYYMKKGLEDVTKRIHTILNIGLEIIDKLKL